MGLNRKGAARGNHHQHILVEKDPPPDGSPGPRQDIAAGHEVGRQDKEHLPLDEGCPNESIPPHEQPHENRRCGPKEERFTLEVEGAADLRSGRMVPRGNELDGRLDGMDGFPHPIHVLGADKKRQVAEVHNGVFHAGGLFESLFEFSGAGRAIEVSDEEFFHMDCR